jgi:HTH-type transcriptional regulator/antitoxin HigA
MPAKFKSEAMNIKPIKTEKDYQKALKRLEVIFNARPGTKEGDELDILSVLIEKYEDEHYHIDAPDPIEAIKFRMEQMGYKQKDLAKIIGYKGRVSEILSRKRKLSLEMIRSLHKKLNIPLESLVQAY